MATHYLVYLFPSILILIWFQDGILAACKRQLPSLNRSYSITELLGICIIGTSVILGLLAIANYGTPPYFLQFWVDAWAAIAITLYLASLVVAMGFTYLSRFRSLFQGKLELTLISAAIGFGTLLLALTAISFAHMLTTSVILIGLVLFTISAIPGYLWLTRTYKQIRFQIPSLQGAYRISYFLYPLIAILWLSMFLSSFIPEPIHGDSLRVYMNTAKIYVDNAGVVAQPYDLLSHYPHYGEMFYALSILLGDISIASLFNLVLIFFCYGAMVLLYREVSGKQMTRPMMLSFFFFVPILSHASGLLKPDSIAVFFVLMATFLLVRYRKSKHLLFLLLMAMCVGLAIGTKYAAMVYLPGFAIAYLLVEKRPRHIFTRGILVAAIIIALFSPWGMLNYQTIGNPLAPAFLDVMHSDSHFYSQFGDQALRESAEAERADAWMFFYYDQYPDPWYYPTLPFTITSSFTNHLFTYQSYISGIFLIFAFLLFSKKLLTDEKLAIISIITLSSLILFVPILHAQVWYILPTFLLLLVLYQIRFDSLGIMTQKAFSAVILLHALPAMFMFVPTSFYSFSYHAIHYSEYCQTNTCHVTEFNPLHLSAKEALGYYEAHSAPDELLLDANWSSILYFVDDAHVRVIPNHFAELLGHLSRKGYSEDQIIEELRSRNIMYILFNKTNNGPMMQAIEKNHNKSDLGPFIKESLDTLTLLRARLPILIETDRHILYGVE